MARADQERLGSAPVPDSFGMIESTYMQYTLYICKDPHLVNSVLFSQKFKDVSCLLLQANNHHGGCWLIYNYLHLQYSSSFCIKYCIQ